MQAIAYLDRNGDGGLSRNEIVAADWNQLRGFGKEVIYFKLANFIVIAVWLLNKSLKCPVFDSCTRTGPVYVYVANGIFLFLLMVQWFEFSQYLATPIAPINSRHLFLFISCYGVSFEEGIGGSSPRRARNASRSPTISDDFGSYTPKRDEEM